jgi:predicted CoA-binding protein
VLREARTIAVVGASDDPTRPVLGVMRYLREQGYGVLPIRRGGGEVLGRPAAGSLAELDVPPDVVDAFVRSERAPDVAREAVAAGAAALWLQPGCRSAEAGRIARAAGLAFVEDRCTRQVHRDERVGPMGPAAREARP